MLNHKNIHLSNDYLVFFYMSDITLGDGYTKENKTQFLRSTWRERHINRYYIKYCDRCNE